MKKLLMFGACLSLTAVVLTSCSSSEVSSTTGWAYNDKKWGGFEKKEYPGPPPGPNLV
jgi:hypothetical protein